MKQVKKQLLLIYESLSFALKAIVVNKVRTTLSLLGITIGIFSIIAVFTIFDSVEKSIRTSIESLGSNVLYVQKWEWGGNSEYPWWKFLARPNVIPQELADLQRRSNAAENMAYMAGQAGTVKAGNNAVEGVSITGVSHEYDQVMTVNVVSGRYFTPIESSGGRPVAIVGAKIADDLFEGKDPVGESIKVFGQRVTVIGLLQKEGESAFGNSNDNSIIIPVNYLRNFASLTRKGVEGTIAVKAKPNVSNEELRNELTGNMRAIRKLKPGVEDDFSINETGVILQTFDGLFKVVGMVGWIIGGFSLIVGGFGIANIMFVSVKERTSQIGIQKAIGAKKSFVLQQFLFEAVFLAILGGLVGLLIIYLITLAISAAFDMDLVLTAKNIILGISVSAIIGLVSGFIPAWSASKLDPVEAMRSTF